jgi:hypothetical protein
MCQTHWTTMASAVAGSLLLLGASGCGDSTDSSGAIVLSVSETNDIGDALADEVDQAVGSITTEGAEFSVDGSQAGAAFSAPPGSGCATADNTTDTDADGAPDDATFTFALPACRFTGFRGGTLEITGTINLSDPTPAAADFDYLATLTDFQFKLTSPNATHTFTATRNGTRTLSGSAAGVSLSNNLTLVRSAPSRTDATITHDLMLSFTPSAGQVLALGQPLPSGTFTKSGTFTWSRGTVTRTFTVTTVVPLAWDATCTTDRKIASGEIHATLADGGYIKTVWSGCGADPTRTFVRAVPTA